MQAPTRLILVRHGEVEERYHRIFGGVIDMNLSPRGHDQARATAAWLARQDHHALYVSPMRRVQQTLAPLLPLSPHTPVILDDLREVDFGQWTGLGWEQIRERFQVSAYHWLQELDRGGIPGAEDAASYRARVQGCLHRVLREQKGRTSAILCHGGVIRMFLSLLLDLPLPKTALFEIDYASVSIVELHPEKTEVQLLNFAPWRDAVA